MTSKEKSERIAQLEAENARLTKELAEKTKAASDAWQSRYARDQEIEFLREVVRAAVGVPKAKVEQ